MRLNCEDYAVNYLEDIKWFLPNSKTFCDMADVFAIYADPTRLKILTALSLRDMCVGDLAYLLNMTKSAVSHQLKVLKEAKLIKSEKRGKNVYYSLNDHHVQTIFEKALEHILEED